VVDGLKEGSVIAEISVFFHLSQFFVIIFWGISCSLWRFGLILAVVVALLPILLWK